MSFAKSNYLKQKILNHFLGKSSYAFPSNVYFGLFKSDPTSSGILTGEVSGGSYARVDITSLLNTADPSGFIASGADITFPTATADWGLITHGAVIDSATLGAGNILWFGPATVSRSIEINDVFRIGTGAFNITEL